MKKYILLVFVIALVLSFMLGIYLHKLEKIDEQIAFEAEYQNLESKNIIKEAEAIIKETSSKEEKIGPNAKLIEKKYFNECEHLTTFKKNVPEEFVNKTKAELQIEYIGWEIQKFTNDEVIVYKEINDFCDEHYLLKDTEGKITIFLLDKYGNEKEIIRETEIETKYLPELDIENLKEGIKVYGNEELNKLLEDYE